MHRVDRLAERRLRLGSSAIVALAATVVAAAAHAAGGGGIPSIAAVAIALPVSIGLGMLIVGPRPGRARLAAGVIVDQLVFHTLFSFFGAAGAGSATHSVGAHAHHGTATLELSAAAESLTAPMLLAHAGAAVLAYALLRWGLHSVEAAVRAVVIAVLQALDAPRPLAPTPVSPATARQFVLPRLGGLAQRLELRRGPPFALAA